MKRDPTWIRCTLWERKAEALAKYITKGKMVVVSGPVDVECWISRQGGEAQAAIVCTVREFTFCGGGEKPEDAKKPA